MIVYADTSALVKLYIEEDGSETTHRCMEDAEFAVTSRVAYVEARSAFARRKQAGDLTQRAHRQIVRQLNDDWKRWLRLDFQSVPAGELAAKHLLRGFDAVHLSSALGFSASKEPLSLLFLAFDARLNTAAEVEGLTLAQ